jgi:kynurenine formamidase
MAKKIRYVDLSIPMANLEVTGFQSDDAKLLSPSITYVDHKASLPVATRIYECTADDFPQGLAWAAEVVTLGTHAGTHLDAPYHYFPTSEGKPAKTIDQMPLELCFGKGVVFDMRHKQSGEYVTVADLEAACEKMGHMIEAGEVALIMTGADKRISQPDYWQEYPGVSREATLWLIERGVKLMGTDAMGWDVPFHHGAARFRATGDKAVLWEAHRVGIEHEYYHIEKLGNLDQLPPFGFDLVCIPISILGASAGWVRPVAIIRED